MTEVFNELMKFKKGYVRHEMLTENLGIVLYTNDDKHEIYEFFEDEDSFILENESILASMDNDFEFTSTMFDEKVEQRKFELSTIENKEEFKGFPTILASVEKYKELRPHMLYKNNEIFHTIHEAVEDDGRERHRCGQCGGPYFNSLSIFQYEGGQEGLESSGITTDEGITCIICGRRVENPSLFIGGFGEAKEE